MSEARDPELLSLDLTGEDACTALTKSDTFDATRATVVVVEGVLMYLQAQAVADLLRSLANLPTPRIRLIASWMIAEPGQPIGFVGQSRLLAGWLRRRGEPMLWGSTPSALPAFLAGLGWGDAQLIDLAEEISGNSKGFCGPVGEQLVLIEKGGMG